jgi:hypothetical protein
VQHEQIANLHLQGTGSPKHGDVASGRMATVYEPAEPRFIHVIESCSTVAIDTQTK